MQVPPIKPKLKSPGTKRLKLECDGLLSNFAFNSNFRRFIKGLHVPLTKMPDGRGLHSSTFELNLSLSDTKYTQDTP